MVGSQAERETTHQSLGYAVLLILATAAYWALGHASLRYGALLHPFVSPVWPNAGFGLALILVYGYRYWPAIFIGAIVTNLEIGASWWTSAGIAAANTLSPLLATYVLLKFFDFQVRLPRLRDAISLILVGAILCRAVSATLAVAVLWSGGLATGGGLSTLWLNRWVGGASGVLLVTPFFLAFRDPVGSGRGWKWYVEALIVFATITLVSAMVFLPIAVVSHSRYPLAFIPLPFVIWAALRFEARGASVGTLLAAAISLVGTLRGSGPFANIPGPEGLLLLALFNGLVGATGLIVAGAVAELKRERTLRASMQLLQQMFERLPIGVWVAGPQGRIIGTNPAARRIWGGEKLVELQEYGAHVGWHGPERKRIEAQEWPLARAVVKGETCAEEQIEIEGLDGVRRTILHSALPLRDAEHRIVGAIAFHQDVSELLRVQEHMAKLATIVEQTDDVVVVTAKSGVIEYVNPAFERTTGFSREEADGKTPAIVKSGMHGQVFYRSLWETILAGKPFREVICNRRKTGEIYYEAKTISPIRNHRGEITHFVSTGKNITERINTEERLNRTLRARRVMAECNRVLVHATREEDMLPEMCRVIVAASGYRVAWVGLIRHDPQCTIEPVASAGDHDLYFESVRISWADDEFGRGPAGTAVRTGLPQATRSIASDPSFAPWRKQALDRGFRAAATLPFICDGNTLGVLGILSAEPEAFESDEISLLQELADDVAFGIQSLRARAERERAERLLKNIAEGTAAVTGGEFMHSLVRTLADALNVRYAFIGRLVDQATRRVCTVAVWANGNFGDDFEFDVAGTPCERVIGARSPWFIQEGLREQFPQAHLLQQMQAESYFSMPLLNSAGKPLGVLVVLDDKPMTQTEQMRSVVTVFAARACADLERIASEYAMRESEARFRQLSENIREVFFLNDAPDNRTLYVSPAFDEMFGISRKQLYANPWAWVEAIHPEDRERILANLERDGTTGAFDNTFRIVRPDGTERWVRARGFPIRDASGATCRIAGVVEDVTDQKLAELRLIELNSELEYRVRQRTTELERANKELESFSYSVSHDLRAPLRAISGFAAIVLDADHGRLDRDMVNHLERIQAGAKQMERLISDLLELSRVSRSQMQAREFSLSHLAREVVSTLIEAHAGRNIHVLVRPDMRVSGDVGLMRIALENLLGNALKFTSRVEQARIEVGLDKRDGQIAYFVRDNGVGFDMQFADKLFGAFQRLHSQEQFEGTGIGLSIVQRVIARHGGKVWAEAQKGQGATFYFTLEERA